MTHKKPWRNIIPRRFVQMAILAIFGLMASTLAGGGRPGSAWMLSGQEPPSLDATLLADELVPARITPAVQDPRELASPEQVEGRSEQKVDQLRMMRAKLSGILVLYLFLLLTSLTYYFFRRPRRIAEVERILSILRVSPSYRKVYRTHSSGYYASAVLYSSVVSLVGLTVLFLARDIGLPNGEFPWVRLGGDGARAHAVRFPEQGSRLVFGMAFLGAYLWGLQHIFRRYSSNDLSPSVYYGLSMRMILAAIIAVVLYNAYAALAGGGDSDQGITANIWPALAFLIGMFPQRGLRWLTERAPILSQEADPSVRPTPLEMIEGMEVHDALRLEELGIDSCYDLAAADFVPLVLKTPYSARQLIDWILQAKLCVYFGEAVKDLRHHSIRIVTDLAPLTDADIDKLTADTTLTRPALERARDSIVKDKEIERLREAGEELSRFWGREDDLPPPPEAEPTGSRTHPVGQAEATSGSP